VEEALVALLQLLLFRQLCFPLFGKLPRYQPILRLDHIVGTNAFSLSFSLTLPLCREATARYQRRDRRRLALEGQ
jgi:hypothetical protein